MKLDGYLYPQSDDLGPAVAEAMALFAIPTCTEGQAACIAVIVNNILEQPLRVATTIECSGSNSERLEAVSPAANHGENRRRALRRLTQLNLLALLTRSTGHRPGPWGILRGVRPAKLAHRLIDQGLAFATVQQRMEADYGLTTAKAKLATEVAFHQRPFFLPADVAAKTCSVYIGIPFCPSRCLYCSFPANVLPERRTELDNFLAALERDMHEAAALTDKYGLSVQNLYIGGGTPTSLPDADFERLLTLTGQLFKSPALREFTVEAGRPDSIDDAKIAAMHRAGVTRVSVNPQTMQEKTLKLIGR
ncbi:MAG: radical SAM protein, partial [Negativicutes bacterium]|nr:radical SAM protein [Negativicutes bacterium]